MKAKLAELEEYYCALMNYAGVSWGVLATYCGVSRQAMHRRMASRVDGSVERAQEFSEENRRDLIRELHNIQSAANFLIDSPDEKISDAVRTWQERRKRAGWWRDSEQDGRFVSDTELRGLLDQLGEIFGDEGQ